MPILNIVTSHLRVLIDTILALVWCVTPHGAPSYLNKRTANYTGMILDPSDPPEAGSRRSFMRQAIVHPDELTELERPWFHSIRAGEPFERSHRFRCADGAHRWVDARAEPLRASDGRIVHWYGVDVDVDVDDSRQAEEVLRGRAGQLRLLIDAIPALVWCATPDGEPEQAHGRFYWHEHSEGGSLGCRARQDIVHPVDLPDLERLWSISVQTRATLSIRHRLRQLDGVYRWVDLRAEPLRNDDGDIVQWYGVCVDIEDEARMQDALHATHRVLPRLQASRNCPPRFRMKPINAGRRGGQQSCVQRWLSAEPPNLQRARVLEA